MSGGIRAGNKGQAGSRVVLRNIKWRFRSDAYFHLLQMKWGVLISLVLALYTGCASVFAALLYPFRSQVRDFPTVPRDDPPPRPAVGSYSV